MLDSSRHLGKENFMSLWCCRFKSEELLHEYVEINYGDDYDDKIAFELGRDFSINWYDEDFAEVSYNNEMKRNISDLLKDHSFSETFLSSITDVFGEEFQNEFNAIIVLYNIAYDGLINHIDSHKYGYIEFMGVFRYHKDGR